MNEFNFRPTEKRYSGYRKKNIALYGIYIIQGSMSYMLSYTIHSRIHCLNCGEFIEQLRISLEHHRSFAAIQYMNEV